MKLLLIFTALFLLNACSEQVAVSPSTDTSEPIEEISNGQKLSYSGLDTISLDNENSFTLQGLCVGSESVEIRGSILAQASCENDRWSVEVDLGYLTSGRFSIEISQGEENIEVFLEKSTILREAAAAYLFEDVSDPGVDSSGSHTIVTNQVNVVSDSERGLVLEVDGVSADFQVSDGSFLNDAFSERSISIWFFANDLSTSQFIYEEGGSTNGLAIKIENEELIAATRAGGSGTQEEVRVSLSGLLQKWVHLAVVFDNGTLSVFVDGVETSKTLPYSSIPNHGNDGGIGATHDSSNSFGTTAVDPFNGRLDNFAIFEKVLSESERDILGEKETTLPLVSIDPLSVGRVASYSFVGDVDVDDLGLHDAVSFVDVVQIIDAEQGEVAEFNGSTSEFRLSDGSFLNDAFSEKTIAMSVKPDGLLNQQVLYDEGGTTNGLVIWIEDGYLFVAARSGGESTQANLIHDIIDLSDQWIDIALVFDEGQMELYINNELVVERTADFTEVVAHSDTGGLGRRHGGGDASGQSGSAIYSGLMDDVFIYDRALSFLEISNL